ncbi:hypothetical protein HETIRDRAFT_454379 [Heterobasidion irregulare TC 32-1]|uniref:BTB domain-containing protein n=1 Tax=Heterobasidion irregulare (strain TC 32-1) TaxID=747525 RepID=W4K014_HETIT|nr:uncharacterized protein HETIRDRAFT_454379 [Heterobasidion irregulare TC 32-1]ETW78441.1 hypothetical protein HETIRDRAFT_454379 [Heterobasidion irregulare TC 32-1]
MASIDTPSDRERPRTELDAELLINHPALYFDDGDVILQCGKTLFRVHRGILLKHSTLFQEMLAPARDTLRDCTLLKVVDDKDDMEAFLNTIHDGFTIDASHITIEKLPTLSGILRLAYKYRPHTEDLIVHPAAVIALLRSINYADNALLSALFYDLNRRTQQLGGAYGHHLASLSEADIGRLMSCHALVSGFWHSPAGQRCLLNMQDLISQPVENWELVKGQVQGTLALPGLSLTGLCSTCRAEMVKYVGQQQATLWGSLSRHFDLAEH